MIHPAYRQRFAWSVVQLLVGLLPILALVPAQTAMAACSGNAVVCENQNPGPPDTVWDISGSGDPSIQGFATDISFNKGDTVGFKVDTPASAYTVTIYRIGYYQGNGARWKIRWENSIDGSNTPNRTMVSYKETKTETQLDPADPPTWTGTWRDATWSPPADGGRPENALKGTISR